MSELRQRKTKRPDGNKSSTPKKPTTTSKTPTVQETDRLLQFLILVGLLAPYAVIAAGKWPTDEDRSLQERLLSGSFLDAFYFENAWPIDVEQVTSTSFLKLVGWLSSPHILYFFVWTNASLFKSLFETILFRWIGRPYQVFAALGYVLKVVQGIAFAIWYLDIDVSKVLETQGANLLQVINYEEVIRTLVERDVVVLISALQLIVCGLTLNFFVYRGLKEAGVYYGTRLGEEVPWFFGFPFSVISHPQYVGSAMIIQGGCLALATPEQVTRGLYVVALALTLLYAFSSVVESKL